MELKTKEGYNYYELNLETNTFEKLSQKEVQKRFDNETYFYPINNLIEHSFQGIRNFLTDLATLNSLTRGEK